MANGLTKQLGDFFNDNEVNSEGVSKYRLYLMRVLFVLTFLFLGKDAWTGLITHEGIWNPLEGVAYSFWAAYSTLMILGLRRPLKMTPMLLLQFFYKLVWLIGVAFPLWRDNHFDDAKGLTIIFIVGIVLDLLIIPWKYVFKKYFSTNSN
jgi:hypothetical protein